MLNSRQKKKLRAKAHNLKPLILIGKAGVTDGCIKSIDQAIESHELVKVKFIEHKDDKKNLSSLICKDVGAEIVGSIGHTIMLFRQNPDQEKQKYKYSILSYTKDIMSYYI